MNPLSLNSERALARLTMIALTLVASIVSIISYLFTRSDLSAIIEDRSLNPFPGFSDTIFAIPATPPADY